MPRRLLIIVNVDWFFLSHRLPIAKEALANGYEVHIATGITNRVDELLAHGFHVHPLPIKRGGVGPLNSFAIFKSIYNLCRIINPDIVHLVTIKPVLLGGIALRMLRVPAVVAAVSGLGFAFTDRGLIARCRRMVLGWMYRLALGHENIMVIFQNRDDRDRIVSLARVSEKNVTIIRGSGVDLEHYKYTPYPSGVPKVILAARMLRDKGVREFVEAARILMQPGRAPMGGARYILVGDPDPENHATLFQEELDAWKNEGIVEVWGVKNDMQDVLASSALVVLPSYREGLPKVLLEAAACGRPVVTTNVPGCRDAIEPNTTGLLVPVRQAEAIADAIKTLLDNPKRCAKMGKAGRELAKRDFDINNVVHRHMQIYTALLDMEKE